MIKNITLLVVISVLLHSVFAQNLVFVGTVTPYGLFPPAPTDCLKQQGSYAPTSGQLNPFVGESVLIAMDVNDPNNAPILPLLPANASGSLLEFCWGGNVIEGACGYGYSNLPTNLFGVVEFTPSDLISLYGAPTTVAYTCYTQPPAFGYPSAAFFVPTLPVPYTYTTSGYPSLFGTVTPQGSNSATITFNSYPQSGNSIANMAVIGPAPQVVYAATSAGPCPMNQVCTLTRTVTCPATYWVSSTEQPSNNVAIHGIVC